MTFETDGANLRPQRQSMPPGLGSAMPTHHSHSGHDGVPPTSIPPTFMERKILSTKRSKKSRPREHLYIAVMGITGVGKSTFISLASGKDVRVGHDLKSCTVDVQDVEFEWNEDVILHLIDTPGFNDTGREEASVLRDIANWMSSSFQQGLELSGILYLHPISNTRMQGSDINNLTMIQKLCGEHCFQDIILASTKWSDVDAETGAARERELISTPEFWGNMCALGSRVMRHDQGRHSALAILRRIVNRGVTCTTRLQDEVVNQGKGLEQTAAAEHLNAAIIAERKENQKKLEAMKTLLTNENAFIRKMAEDNMAKLKGEITESKEAQDALKTSLEQLQKDKAEEFAKFKAQMFVEAREKEDAYRAEMKERMEKYGKDIASANVDEIKNLRMTWKKENDIEAEKHRKEMESIKEQIANKGKTTFFGKIGDVLTEMGHIASDKIDELAEKTRRLFD